MIQNVECFQAERRAPVLVDHEDARNLRIELQRTRAPERIFADVSVRSQSRAAGGRG